MGGVRVEMRVPLPLPANPRRGIINELVGTGRSASTDVDQEA